MKKIMKNLKINLWIMADSWIGSAFSFWYSMKIKEQTRKLAVGCSKHCFEVVDKTDEVSHIYTARRSWRGLKRFSKSMRTAKRLHGWCSLFFLFEITLKEFFCTLFFRIGEEVFWFAFFSNHALIHKDNTVRDITGKFHLVGYNNHSQAFLS